MMSLALGLFCAMATPEPLPGVIAIAVDNDVPFADRHYSSGVFVSAFLPSDIGIPLEPWVRGKFNVALEPLTGGFDAARIGFSLGQELYTPKFYWFSEVQAYDRPFAAWLAARGTFEWWGPRHYAAASVSVGPTGAEALGDAAQTFSHTYISVDSPLPLGWRNQVDLGLGALASSRQDIDVFVLDRLDVRFVAVTLHGLVEAGTIRVRGGVGMSLRVGWFGRRRPTEDRLLMRLAGAGSPMRWLLHRAELSFYLRGTAHAVAYDGFLQGPILGEAVHATRPHWLTGDIEGGWTAALWNLRLRAGVTFQSPRAVQPFDTGHQYWSVRLGWGFGRDL